MYNTGYSTYTLHYMGMLLLLFIHIKLKTILKHNPLLLLRDSEKSSTNLTPIILHNLSEKIIINMWPKTVQIDSYKGLQKCLCSQRPHIYNQFSDKLQNICVRLVLLRGPIVVVVVVAW